MSGAAQAAQPPSYQQFWDEITNAPVVASAVAGQSNAPAATSYQQFPDNLTKAPVVDNNLTSQPGVPVAKSYQESFGTASSLHRFQAATRTPVRLLAVPRAKPFVDTCRM